MIDCTPYPLGISKTPCDHPWFQLVGREWCCTVCKGPYGSEYNNSDWMQREAMTEKLDKSVRRAAAIDEAVRRVTSDMERRSLVATDRGCPCSWCVRVINRIRAEFARIMSQDDLESAGNGMGMR